jgi:hypothetical protein
MINGHCMLLDGKYFIDTNSSHFGKVSGVKSISIAHLSHDSLSVITFKLQKEEEKIV